MKTDYPGAWLVMPIGPGVLYQAARFLQTGAGVVRVFGQRHKGADIRWHLLNGGKVYIERKDRAFEAGTSTKGHNWKKFFEKHIKTAAPNIPKKKDKPARVTSARATPPSK